MTDDNGLSPRDERELDAMVDPDREVTLSDPLTGYPDDFEVLPGLTYGEIQRRLERRRGAPPPDAGG